MTWRAWAALALAACCAGAADGPRRSGFDDMSPATQALQRDDAANPGMLGVLEGQALWAQPAGTAQRSLEDLQAAPSGIRPSGGRAGSCAGCHGELAASMRGVAARYPAFDDTAQRPVTLSQRIAQCRSQRQGVAGDAAANLLALEAAVAHASRGLPVAPPQDERLTAARTEGATLFKQRLGQLDLSCAHCHDERAGLRLGGSLIPQGHPNGYPIYRLQWQALGGLQRRLRNCLTGVRAEAWPADAPQWVALELYLMQRAAGMTIETPGVRP